MSPFNLCCWPCPRSVDMHESVWILHIWFIGDKGQCTYIPLCSTRPLPASRSLVSQFAPATLTECGSTYAGNSDTKTSPVQIPSGGDVSCTWRITQDWIKRMWKYSFRVIKVWKSRASAIGSKINKFSKPINPWEARDILKAAHYLSHRGSVLYKKWHVLTASLFLLCFMKMLVTELCVISFPSM